MGISSPTSISQVWLELCLCVSEGLRGDGDMKLGGLRSHCEGPSRSPTRIYISFCNRKLLQIFVFRIMVAKRRRATMNNTNQKTNQEVIATVQTRCNKGLDEDSNSQTESWEEDKQMIRVQKLIGNKTYGGHLCYHSKIFNGYMKLKNSKTFHIFEQCEENGELGMLSSIFFICSMLFLKDIKFLYIFSTFIFCLQSHVSMASHDTDPCHDRVGSNINS